MSQFNLRYVLALSFVSAMGGLLFGYDWVVIGGAKPFYELYFDLKGSPSLQGWAMSSALVGCLTGAAVAGTLADRLGRKLLLILAGALFTLSAFGTGYAESFTPFVIYRIAGGIGIGLASTLSPMYIAEVSPAQIRGRFVSLNQLTIVIGILAAQIANWQIAEPIPDGYTDQQILNSWNGQWGWRWMFWAEMFPASLFFILMFFVPESPRFLARQRKDDKVLNILSRVGGMSYARSELSNIKDTLKDNTDKVNYRDLLHPRILPILVVGIVLAVFQQWCGLNVVFNYAEEIFASAGYDVSDILLNIVITGSINLIFTLVAMRTVDQWGRRLLMLIGSGGLTVTYIFLGGFYYFNFDGFPVLLMVLLAIAIYAMSLAPVTWVVLSEIFPNRIRGAAVAVCTFFLWGASFMLAYTFPLLNSSMGTHGTFWIYSGITLAGFIFIKLRLPETKGKSLEEIERDLIRKNS
ncbi:MAG: sugar porter family MFS transporter [Bacteroidota bacterium]